MADQPTSQAKDFFTVYANNVQFELQALDLRMLFGQTRQGQSPEQQGVVIVSWPEAKLTAHFLALNLALYEGISGKITIPPDMIPSEPPPLTPEQEKDPIAKAIHATSARLHRELLASL